MATSNLCKDEDDESKIQETRGDASSLAKYLHIMNSYGREIIFVIALIFTGIAALQNGYDSTSILRPKFKFSPARLHCTGVNKSPVTESFYIAMSTIVAYVLFK